MKTTAIPRGTSRTGLFLRLALAAACAVPLAAAVACGGGAGKSDTDASSYYGKLALVLGDTAKKRGETAAPTFTGADLTAEEEQAIQERYGALSGLLGDAADAMDALTPPSNVQDAHDNAAQGLRLQSEGLAELANTTPSLDTLNSDLTKKVLPAQRAFASACAELQRDASKRGINAPLSCDL